jgi:hypothetical protein
MPMGYPIHSQFHARLRSAELDIRLFDLRRAAAHAPCGTGGIPYGVVYRIRRLCLAGRPGRSYPASILSEPAGKVPGRSDADGSLPDTSIAFHAVGLDSRLSSRAKIFSVGNGRYGGDLRHCRRTHKTDFLPNHRAIHRRKGIAQNECGMFERMNAGMKSSPYLHAGLGAALLAVVLLGAWVWVLSSEVRGVRDKASREMAAYEASVKNIQAEMTNTKPNAPGLGEFMTTIQLHVGKLWYAGKASYWELAQYELDELQETMESARTLHAVKNGVDISGVLDSVIQTQVAELSEAIKRKKQNDFVKAYDETLSACNGCHQESGHNFIQIVRPSAPPVTNQRWEPPIP